MCWGRNVSILLHKALVGGVPRSAPCRGKIWRRKIAVCWAAARGRASWQAVRQADFQAVVPEEHSPVRLCCSPAPQEVCWLHWNGRTASILAVVALFGAVSWSCGTEEMGLCFSKLCSYFGYWKHFFCVCAVLELSLALFSSWSCCMVCYFNADVWGASDFTWVLACYLRGCKEELMVNSLLYLLLANSLQCRKLLDMGYTWFVSWNICMEDSLQKVTLGLFEWWL